MNQVQHLLMHCHLFCIKPKKAVCWSCPNITLKTYICMIMLHKQKLHLKMTSVKSLSVNIFLTHSVSPFLRLARYVN